MCIIFREQKNISKKSYDQLLKKYITVPFKMKSTGLNSKENFIIKISFREYGKAR
jgi:hypothetical protein